MRAASFHFVPLALAVASLLMFSRTVVDAFLGRQLHVKKTPLTIHYYDYFKRNKDGSKKDVGRLWKNIIFPGIYTDYEDTAEPIKTVVVKTDKPVTKGTKKVDKRNEGAYLETGKYNVADEKSVPVYGVSASQATTAPKLPRIQKPANFKPPAPKKGLIPKLGSGTTVLPGLNSQRPKKPLILYESESDADCRKVRLACSLLDLTVEFRPCPGKIYGFNDQLSFLTGGARREIPYLVDNNPSMVKPQVGGAKDIIEYLFLEYGNGNIAPSSLQKVRSGGRGNKPNSKARPDNIKMKPLSLYGWEGANYVTPVRETLSELSLPHIFINCAEGSVNRKKLESKTKTFQVPYLVDPNTGIEMFESKEICQYLEQVYTL